MKLNKSVFIKIERKSVPKNVMQIKENQYYKIISSQIRTNLLRTSKCLSLDINIPNCKENYFHDKTRYISKSQFPKINNSMRKMIINKLDIHEQIKKMKSNYYKKLENFRKLPKPQINWLNVNKLFSESYELQSTSNKVEMFKPTSLLINYEKDYNRIFRQKRSITRNDL